MKIPITTDIYLRHEIKQGRRESTTPVIPCMVLAWLKISLHCIILYPVLAITFSLNQTGTALVQLQVNPRTEAMIVTSAVAGR